MTTAFFFSPRVGRIFFLMFVGLGVFWGPQSMPLEASNKGTQSDVWGQGMSSMTRTQRKTFAVGGTPTLSISNVKGPIEIRTHDKSGIKVEWRQCLGVDGKPTRRVLIRKDGGHVHFSFPRRMTDIGFGPRCGFHAAYRAWVPKKAVLFLLTISGRLSVVGVRGRMRLSNVSGDTKVRDGGAVRIRSVSGDVRVWGLKKGDVRITNVSGKIRASGLSVRNLRLNNVSGDIELEDVKVGELCRCKSVSGELSLLGYTPGLQTHMKSMSGGIKLVLREKAGAQIEARTFSGNVRSSLPMGIRIKGKAPHLRKIRINSFSGVVEIR